MHTDDPLILRTWKRKSKVEKESANTFRGDHVQVAGSTVVGAVDQRGDVQTQRHLQLGAATKGTSLHLAFCVESTSLKTRRLKHP